MTITLQPGRYLSNNQYIKLFSNPVSGIAFYAAGGINNMELPTRQRLWKIRYSKSMILKALNFWFDQLHSYYLKIYKIRKNSLIDVSEHMVPHMVNLRNIMNMIECLPDTFLFSHRHIQDAQKGGGRYPNPINQQLTLLDKKYPNLIKKCTFYGIQNQTMDPYFMIKTTIGIEFSIFPCEHPYIEKQKISKVGITDNGNVYILHPVGKKK